ncbi:MAG: c-type cytochrome [Deltaproteobacteria bacterium]|nr:c-type cytochrome [Deltaproteobacteria bacterium]MBW2420799.1 c-type cytochrome [Deltaproteobacteria bacterium]
MVLLVAAATCSVAGAASADFDADLAHVEKALRRNPSQVLPHALDACMTRRGHAIELHRSGYTARAQRRLATCFELLKIPATAPAPKVVTATREELEQLATAELNQALELKPNVANGLLIYRECAACHTPEGWGLPSGSVPQIAGQHRGVVIKQLADIRAGNRDNVLMVPYASVETIGGAQAVADVAAYIDTLEIGVASGKGPGRDLKLGEQLYAEYCARCHGETGEGDAEAFVPRIHSQHYKYLVRQFEWIRGGKRRNANSEMVEQIQDFGERETHAVLDYVSRLEPAAALQAPADWKNPDFTD